MKFYTWCWWEEGDKSSKPKNKRLEKSLQLLDLERKCPEVDMINVRIKHWA